MQKAKASTRQFTSRFGKKNVSITKNSTGGVVETLRAIKLGKSTVFFKQQQSKQENVV